MDPVIASLLRTFESQKTLAEKAIAQVSDAYLRRPLDENTNSIAVIMKHMSGNMVSRFTDFLTSDGEKSWRNRDDEFVDDFRDRGHIMQVWNDAWETMFNTLYSLVSQDLDKMVTIRGEPHSVPLALHRALAHLGYHTGQIVLTARVLCKDKWNTITVPRGGSAEHNKKMGYQA